MHRIDEYIDELIDTLKDALGERLVYVWWCAEWETAPHFWIMWMNFIEWYCTMFLLPAIAKLYDIDLKQALCQKVTKYKKASHGLQNSMLGW